MFSMDHDKDSLIGRRGAGGGCRVAIRAPRSFHCHWFCSISFMILQKEALIMLERVELANLFLFILCKDERATLMLSTFGILNGTPFHHSFIRAHTHTSIWKMFTHRTHIDPFKVTLTTWINI